MRRNGARLLLIAFMLFSALSGEATDLRADAGTLRISGPPVADSLAFAIMADRPETHDMPGIIFIAWNSPDQVRALIAGNRVDCAIITTSAAAIFYQRGIKIKIASVFKSPLWVVSASGTLSEANPHLAGTLLFPFGHREMPELLFNAVFGNQNPNLSTRHTGGPLEAVNFLLMGKGDHALLTEPAATMAVARSGALGRKKAPKLVKNIDIRQKWAEKFDGQQLFVSGLAVFGKTTEQTQLIAAVLSEYQNTLAWIKNNPGAAYEIARQKFPALAAQAMDNRIPGMDITMASGGKAFADALFFLKRLFALSPASTGGKPPEADLFVAGQ